MMEPVSKRENRPLLAGLIHAEAQQRNVKMSICLLGLEDDSGQRQIELTDTDRVLMRNRTDIRYEHIPYPKALLNDEWLFPLNSALKSAPLRRLDPSTLKDFIQALVRDARGF